MNRYVPYSTPYRFRGNPVQQLVASYSARAIFFILLHIPLTFAFKWNPAIATAHSAGTFALGLWFLAHDKYPDRLIYLTAYITGAELLWRGAHGWIFYEFGKYSVGFLLILGLLKYRKLLVSDKRPLIYFLFLLPSILVLPVFDREAIAFNLTGPFALAVATMFFSTVKLTQEQMKRVFISLLAPIVGLGFVASYGTSVFRETIVFGGESIRETAAGFGPNQVSSILGLGALAAFLYVFIDREHKGLRLLMIGSMIWLMAQATLTFSRGGVWTGIGAISVASLYLLRNRKSRVLFILIMGSVFLVSNFYVFPALNRFTEDTVSDRFRSFEPTGRVSIVRSDLDAFMEHPIAGVGPDQSKPYHEKLFRYSSAHTEYSRMLAEHGSFGLVAMLILLWMALQRFISRLPSQNKAYTLAFITWALLFMTHAAMRLVAPSFVFGLASATLLLQPKFASKR
jgi:hypothetical protein